MPTLIPSRLLSQHPPKKGDEQPPIKTIEEELKTGEDPAKSSEKPQNEDKPAEESKVLAEPEKMQDIDNEQVGKIYEEIIVALLDILNYLYVISPKELIAKFIQDRELSMALGVYFFLTPNEGVRLQILEFYRQAFDNTQSEPQ